MRQIKLTTRHLLWAHENSSSYGIARTMSVLCAYTCSVKTEHSDAKHALPSSVLGGKMPIKLILALR